MKLSRTPLILIFLLMLGANTATSTSLSTAVFAQPGQPPPPPGGGSPPPNGGDDVEVIEVEMEVDDGEERPFASTSQFRHLNSNDGLPVNQINSIFQDSHGHIWVGTSDGLSRYDGYVFTTYKFEEDDENSLSNNYINDITEDADGMLWIATNGGASRFNPSTEQFTRYQHDPENENSMGGDMIVSVFADSVGNIWFGGIPPYGLNKLNIETDVVTRYTTTENEFVNGAAWDMVEDESGIIWMMFDGIVQRYDPKMDTYTSVPLPANERRLFAMVQDENGRLWFGGDKGLYQHDPETKALTHYNVADSIETVIQDENGRLWLGTQKQGVFVFDPQTETIVQQYKTGNANPQSLSSDNINTIMQDDAGIIWIGSDDRGINLYNPAHTQFDYYRYNPLHDNSLTATTIGKMSGDEQGNLWAITDNDLNYINFDEGQVTHYLADEFFADTGSAISTVLNDSQGNVWLGERSGNILRLNSKTGDLEAIELHPPLPVDPTRPNPPTQVTTIIEDSQENIWVAVIRDGLYMIDAQQQIVAYDVPNPDNPKTEHTLAAPQINVITVGSDGYVWVGYESGELSRLDPISGLFTHYFKGYRDNPRGKANGMLVDENGRLWIATNEGLTLFNPETETFTSFTEEDGLPSALITAVLPEDNGMLWLSTAKGLVEWNPQTNSVVHVYGAEDGLQGDQFIPNSAWKAEDGRLHFGGNNGITSFYPDNLIEDSYQPTVILTDMRLFNEHVPIAPDSLLTQPLHETQELVLGPDDSIVSFDFAALSYAAPEKTIYRYQLEQYENDWNVVGSKRRFATYTNLPAGDYTLRVQSQNQDGTWNEQEASLNIIVTPPWWQTWWFRIALVGRAASYWRLQWACASVFAASSNATKNWKRKLRCVPMNWFTPKSGQRLPAKPKVNS